MGVIIDGIYYRDGEKPQTEKRTSTDKQYDHDMQRLNHQRDLLQPWVNGKPNEKFREQYPEESKNYYGGNNGKNKS